MLAATTLLTQSPTSTAAQISGGALTTTTTATADSGTPVSASPPNHHGFIVKGIETGSSSIEDMSSSGYPRHQSSSVDDISELEHQHLAAYAASGQLQPQPVMMMGQGPYVMNPAAATALYYAKYPHANAMYAAGGMPFRGHPTVGPSSITVGAAGLPYHVGPKRGGDSHLMGPPYNSNHPRPNPSDAVPFRGAEKLRLEAFFERSSFESLRELAIALATYHPEFMDYARGRLRPVNTEERAQNLVGDLLKDPDAA